MNNKIAIVTGGAKRIGKEIVKHLVQSKWTVIIHYNKSEKEAQDLRNSLPKNSTFLLQQDFAKKFCEKDLFQKIQILTANKKPTLLINNASCFENDTIETLTTESFVEQIMTNCIAPILLGREFAKNNKESSIINILDLYAFENSRNFASHQISKAALFKATKQMALEFAKTTRVNSITPSFVIQNHKQNSKIFQENIKESLLKHPINTSDICSAIDFIINTPSLTGENITLDCGRKIVV
jgi:NAD(P)-dependent dehydrogenase (short-subunit alcohol dehydrogenase family)